MARRWLWVAGPLVGLLGCADAQPSDMEPNDELDVQREAVRSSVIEGKRLFKREKFGTNDRTCETCHTLSKPGTLSPADVQAIFAENPNDPLFRIIDGDDLDNDGVVDGDVNGNGVADPGESITYNRLLTNATNRVFKTLPAGVTIAGRPGATKAVLNRAIPAMFNSPALDPLAMYDGRNGLMECTPNFFDPNILTAQTGQKCLPVSDFDGDGDFDQDDRRGKLIEQAAGAVDSHFQPSTAANPDADPVLYAKLTAIADFQTSLFAGRKASTLAGLAASYTTAEELIDIPNDAILPPAPRNNPDAIAGRKFFLAPGEDPTFTRPAFCGGCHTGAMLDTIPGPIPTALERGNRFATIFSSFFNSRVSERTPDKWPVFYTPLNPVQAFEFDLNGDATPDVTIPSADPGLALVTGKPEDLGRFRILSLWNVKNTAPYFHDNSAHTLEEVVEHYDQFFNTISGGFFNEGGAVDITTEEKRQIVAYLRTL